MLVLASVWFRVAGVDRRKPHRRVVPSSGRLSRRGPGGCEDKKGEGVGCEVLDSCEQSFGLRIGLA